jgi:hypothetical protein
MLRRAFTGTRPSRVLLAGGLFGLLALAAAPAAGQPPAGTQAPAPRFAVALTVTDKGDDKDKKAIEKANEYFAGLAKDAKDDAKLKKLQDDEAARAKAGEPPAFPNPEAPKPAGPSAADLAAAAALPPIGVGEGLMAGLLQKRAADKPSPEGYRWVKLAGQRELRILGLDPAGKNFKDAAAAKDKVFVHPRFGFPIYSRPAAEGKTPDFFMLVYEPDGTALITEADLNNVTRAGAGQPGLVIYFNELGKAKLADLTNKYKPAAATPGRYMALVSSAGPNAPPGVIEIVRIAEAITNGRMQTGASLAPDEFDRLYQQIQALIPARPSSPN